MHWCYSQVIQEAQRRAGETIEKTEFEKREALEAEMPGFAGIKHHVTQDEVSRRRLSLQQNSVREEFKGQDLKRASQEGASGATPNGGSGAGPGVFLSLSNREHDRMEKGTQEEKS